MNARRTIVATTTLVGAACLALIAAPVAGASPTTTPGLLTSAQVPGFHASKPVTKTITTANVATCDTVGPAGGSFSLVNLTRGGVAGSFDAISEGVIHTSGSAAATKAIGGLKSYVAHCLGDSNGGYTKSGGAAKYTVKSHPVAALAGTGKGVEIVISATTYVARRGAETVTKLNVPLIAYPAGGNVLFVVPLHYAYAHAGTTTTVTVGETADLSAVLAKALPLAVKDL